MLGAVLVHPVPVVAGRPGLLSCYGGGVTDLLRLARDDFDRAQAAYHADPCEANRAAYEAAAWAWQAAVTRAIDDRSPAA